MVKKEECVFCHILAGTAPSSPVYDDPICFAFMDIQPINAGHTLVIPIKHASYLADLDGDTLAHMAKVGQRIAGALRQCGLPCEGINFFLADGKAAGQDVFHTHLHILPRFEGDGFGFRFPDGYAVLPTRDELEATAARIRDALTG
jgi:histidine triad (HIT) family protein